MQGRSDVSSSSCKSTNPTARAPPPQPHLNIALGVRASTHGFGCGGHIQSLTLVCTWTGCLSRSRHRPEWSSSEDGPPVLPSRCTEGSPLAPTSLGAPGPPWSWCHGCRAWGPLLPDDLCLWLGSFPRKPSKHQVPAHLPSPLSCAHCSFLPICQLRCVWGWESSVISG